MCLCNIFVHLIYKDSNKENEQKEFICFIEVPKRFQSSSDALPQKIKNESETSTDL
jgi:hypothetical protein